MNTTTTNTYNCMVPYTNYMAFSVELPSGLTDKQAYELLKANYSELIDISCIDFICLDKHDVLNELHESLNNDELQHNVVIEEGTN
jgi:hypothetical protein